jgi:predicted extracellular nuclease
VVSGVGRPFREAGLEVEDAVAQPSTIPRWDNNPEKINFESTRARSAANVARTSIDVDTGATLSNVTGVIDYSFRNYRFTIDFDANPTVAGGLLPAAVTVPTPGEFTVAAYNLERFFNDVDDPGITEPVLTPTAFQNRLNKASLGVRDFLRTPDVVGIVEIENLATLQALATRIGTDAVAAGQPNPQYQAFLVEGNDVGGIDVGFLIKTAPVAGTTPRISTPVATQLGLTTLLKCPDGQDNIAGDRLNDRPPLLLTATVNAPNGASAPVTVIVNHLRSLGGVNDNGAAPTNLCAGTNFATAGDRVRRKRQQQAEFLANLVQARQVANPNENMIVVGDFNAFEFNDGFGDSMGTIIGAPSADNTTIVPGDGADLVNPNLVNLSLSSLPVLQRYGYVFSGNAQNLDHALVSASIIAAAPTTRVEHPRLNSDFGEDNRSDPLIPVRLSDHDPLVVFVRVPGFGLPDAVFSNGFEP